VLVFASSDKGGTGRSVTSCNIAFHLAQRLDVAYLDFDFGSPTAAAVFDVDLAQPRTGETREDARFFELVTAVREALAAGHGDSGGRSAAVEELF